jgi:hypothetical protein
MKKSHTYILITVVCSLIPFEVHLQNKNSGPQNDPKPTNVEIPFAGYWLNDDYFNCIKEFKSPRKANELKGCNFIIIPQKTNENVTMICDFHEETYLSKISKTKKGFEIAWTEQGGISQKLIGIQVISKTQIKIANSNFTKINPSIDKGFLHSSIEEQYLILEEILFKGKYLKADKEFVEFKKNGEVLGLGNFQYYSPIIFYFNDEGLQVDQLYLGKSEQDKKIQPYGFRFNKDTLEIYKLSCIAFDSTSKKCGEVEFGKLMYKLLKIF